MSMSTHNHSHDHHDHHHGGDDHDHSHDHGHPHAAIEEEENPLRYEYLLEAAIRELLNEKGVLSAEQIHRQIDLQDSRTPAVGAQVVARAWVDPQFKARLLEDPITVINEAFELEITTPLKVVVLENTPTVHNVVVCTLCSCYPRMLLGIPPAWYKALDYRSRVVVEPRKVLSEFGTELPADVEVRVSDSTADLRYLVLPMRPAGTAGFSEAQLAALVTRDAMIGTALPLNP
jgi:nitrile hydratase